MKRLLIVDDQQMYLNSLAVSLKKRFEIFVAHDYNSAIAQFDNEIDLALVDIRLDENDENNIDGLNILQWLNSHKPAISCFLMSAYKEFSYADQALNLGAKHFFKKPIDILNLIDILQKKG